jgi:hypothetical protein
MRLHAFQGTFALPQKAQLCNPCLRNELSPFSLRQGIERRLGGWNASLRPFLASVLQAIQNRPAFMPSLLFNHPVV